MPHAIQDLQKRIITEWLPTSGYEYADKPDIEVYTEGVDFKNIILNKIDEKIEPKP